MPSILPSSGQISLVDLYNTFANTYSMNGYYRGQGAVPNFVENSAIATAGALAMNQFYGAMKYFTFDYTLDSGSYSTNFNFKTAAVNAGWNGSQPILSYITFNGVLGSTTPYDYAFTTGGITQPYNEHLIIVTVGSGAYITGAGGPGNYTGTAGPAMNIDFPILLYNNGVIQSGGVGGSGGSGGYGGGGAGYYGGAGAGTGDSGSLTSGGGGGYNSGKGTTNGSAGSGPGAGVAIQGSSLVNYVTTGTIYGSRNG